MNSPQPTERRAEWGLLLIFVILSLGIVVGGTFYYRHYERQFRAAAERQLAAIAELKVGELVQYRKERLEDAALFFNNAAFSRLVRRFFDHPEDADAQRQIQEWTVKLVATDQYDLVRLLDVQGVSRLSLPAGAPPLSSVVLQRLPEILRFGQVTFHDFHRNEHDQRIYLDILTPIFDEQDASRPLGVFYLRIDPDKYLFPFIQRWPVPSETAETLLVRRDGNDALFLNELKFQTNTALNLRISLENTNVAAVKAVLGQEGIVEATDYRGKTVLAALQAIPDSPWFLVARIDTAEVFAPMRVRLWQVVVMICILLFGSGACMGLVWRQQRARYYRLKYEAEEVRAKLSAIVEFSEDAIISKSLDGTITSWNAGAERIYGYSAAEAIGRPIAMLIPPEHSNEFPQLTGKIKRGEAIKHYETVRIRKNGKRIQVSLSLSPVKDEAGAIVGISAIGRDISELKRAEEKLRQSEEKFRTVADWTYDMEIWRGPDGRFLYVSPSAERITGYRTEEFLADQELTLKITHPDDLARVTEHHQKVSQPGNDVCSLDFRIITRRGEERWISHYCQSVYGADGRWLGRRSSNRDITERKRMEDKLRQLSTAVEQSPASIVITDCAGNIEYVNSKFIELTGYTMAEVLGKNPRILKSGEKSPEAYREMWQTITAGKEWDGEFHNKKKNGELYWEIASISPIRDLAGRVTHYVAVKEDITARKENEAEHDLLIRDLQDALADVKSLSGLLPICSSCKKIRDDKGYWSQVESYIQKHSEATFTHGICPDCIKKLYPDLAEGGLGNSTKKTS
jgi:PAS domain S-box-containing protein